MSAKKGKEIKTKKSLRKSRIEIPKNYISFAVVIFCLFVIGGGVYNILEEPNSIIAISSTSYSSLHPYTSDQTSTEAYVVMLIDSFIIAGLYMTHKSSQIAYDRSKANMYLMIGIILIVLGFGGNYAILRIKASIL